MKHYRLKPQVKNILGVVLFYAEIIVFALMMIYANK